MIKAGLTFEQALKENTERREQLRGRTPPPT